MNILLFLIFGLFNKSNWYNWAYWGKSAEIFCNYTDSTRKYRLYLSSGKLKWIYSQKILTISYKFHKDIEDWSLSIADKLIKEGKFTTYHDNTDIISEEGWYAKDVKVGEWKYYDRNGIITKIEKH